MESATRSGLRIATTLAESTVNSLGQQADGQEAANALVPPWSAHAHAGPGGRSERRASRSVTSTLPTAGTERAFIIQAKAAPSAGCLTPGEITGLYEIVGMAVSLLSAKSHDDPEVQLFQLKLSNSAAIINQGASGGNAYPSPRQRHTFFPVISRSATTI